MTRPFAALIVALLSACAPSSSPLSNKPITLPVKITQFYAAPPRVPAGEPALLCYGVEAAAEVKLSPAVEEVHPAVARCFEVHPKETTTYELTARGRGGDETSAKVTVGIGAGRVKFSDLVVSAQEVHQGGPISFCFKAVNATRVTGGPGSFQKGGQPSGDCLIDSPRQTTTYRLTITGAEGATDTEAVTVRVR